jgi:phage shock protein PspC (stress-responsive transcriptional regulator)
MKKGLVLIALIVPGLITHACPACEKQQPKILRGITHGAGPTGNWDYVIVAVAVVITLATLFYAVKWMIKPGEKDLNHIKRTVLN